MDYRIDSKNGFSQKIGELISTLEYTRAVTLEDVKGLSMEALDFLPDDQSNSIGALLMHMAAIEYIHQVISFENRDMTQEELAKWLLPFELGNAARTSIPTNRSNITYKN